MSLKPISNFSAQSDSAGSHGGGAGAARSADTDTTRVVYLDPTCVSVPTTPNREEAAYRSEPYRQLHDSIVASGGNLVPIEVRADPASPGRYTLIYGERRLRACRHAGLQVRAIVSCGPSGDEDFVNRIRENRDRADLSAIEFGRQVKHLLDGPPRTSMASLAENLGCSVSLVSRAYDLATLPEALLQVFDLPQQLRYEDAKALRDAWKLDEKAVQEELGQIRQEHTRATTQELVKHLTRAAQPSVASCKATTAAPVRQLECDGQDVGSWTVSRRGQLELRIDTPMSQAQRLALADHVAAFLKRKVLGGPVARQERRKLNSGTKESPAPAAPA